MQSHPDAVSVGRLAWAQASVRRALTNAPQTRQSLHLKLADYAMASTVLVLFLIAVAGGAVLDVANVDEGIGATDGPRAF